jgi:adenylate cyclase
MIVHHAVRVLVGLAVAGVFVSQAGGWLVLPGLRQLEDLAYDARLKLTLPGGVDSRVVIVDIDERSLREEGQWPWPRGRLADLVDQLFDRYRVAALGFDVVFAEPDPTDAIFKALARGPLGEEARLRVQLDLLRRELDPDRRFAAALRDRPVALGYVFNTPGSPNAEIQFGQLPAPVAAVRELGLGATRLVEAVGYSANLPLLQDEALGGGFFNSPLVDADGIFRRVPLLMRYQDRLYEQLSLAVVRALLGQPPMEFVTGTGYGAGEHSRRLEALRFGGFTAPVDESGAVLVPYRGRKGSFPYVAATDVLAGHADPRILDGAIALVGATAAGLLDLRATPVQNVYPGVEINANLVVGLLDQNFRTRPPYSAGLEILQLILVGLLAIGIGFLNPLRALLLLAATAGALLGINGYLWQAHALVAPLASALVLLFALYVAYTSYNFFVEARRERWITRRFGQYVPREIVAEMSRRGERYSLEGESRHMTVLFSDIVDFTAISERLEPRQLTHLMQCYLTPLTRIIHEHRGTIDKYIGDAIMAFWGAPLADPEHPRHAVQAALAMIAALRALEAEFQAQGWPPLRIRVGINTGMMSVGNMGSEFRMSYTVLGDAVNLASRLESAAKRYGVAIVVSEYTRTRALELVYRELDLIRVKGRTQPVAIYEPLGAAADLTPAARAELTEYEQALRAFRQREWPQATDSFARLLERWPDSRLYALYRDRALALRAAPPPADWDGVFNLESK